MAVERLSNLAHAIGGIVNIDKNSPQGDEVAIAVMGPTGVGKTSFINLVSGSNLRVGRNLVSCTSVVQVEPPFLLDGRAVTLIDTPGFDDTNRSDADILKQIAAFLATTYQNGKKLAGVIYIHRISDVRMGGISTRNFRMFRQLCGESTLKNVVIVTNMWGEVSREVGEAREAELASDDRFFKPVLDQGAKLLRHDNTTESAQAILHYIFGNQPLSLRIQRELVDQKKDISQTAAGEELNRAFAEQMKRHREELATLQQEMRDAIREKDEQAKKELLAETKKLQAEMARVENDSKRLVSDYAKQQAELQKRMTDQAEEAKRAVEKADREYQNRMKELEDHWRNSSQADKSEMNRQFSELQQKYEHTQQLYKNSSSSGGGFFSNLGRALDGLFGL
ncbi:GTP-binding protein A [Favolaschia claudopus]|uniref:GTP-binding protein A n=1 Tax=Favolaschia claudopus TaxID=2862362 RepID=A0AAW0C3W2_9AGAR